MECLGFNCIPVIKSPFLSRPVSRHSDMLYLQTSKNTFLISVCQEQNKIILENAGYTVKMCIRDRYLPSALQMSDFVLSVR